MMAAGSDSKSLSSGGCEFAGGALGADRWRRRL